MDTTTSKSIDLVPLTTLDTESQMKIRDIRNQEDVRKWMYTDHVIGVNEHLDWIKRNKQDATQIIFVVIDDEHNPLGVVSVNAIDLLHKKADWAFYLTKDARGGLGSALEYSFVNFVFDVLDMDKLNCEVIEGNGAVLKLHKNFLFQDEGFRRSNILKNGVRIGVHLLGLTRKDWLSGKEALQKKYARIFDKFSVSIHWQSDQGKAIPNTIDRIELARSRNNLNWMSILRLALEKSPETAKQIIAEIKKIDCEITALTDKLTLDNV